jgi:hypothetical protein
VTLVGRVLQVVGFDVFPELGDHLSKECTRMHKDIQVKTGWATGQLADMSMTG